MGKLQIGKEEVEGEYVPVTPIREDWNEYRVGDYIVRLKLIVSDVFRPKDKIDAEGNPVFIAKSKNVISVRKADV
jgi:hypothetical protein